MSEAILTSEELKALVEASGTGSIGGIAAIEARVLYEMSLSASQSAKAFGDGKTLLVSVDQPSITAIGSAVGTGVSQTLQPQITQNSQQIKDLSDRHDKAMVQNAEHIRTQTARLDHAATQISNIENELRNIHHALGQAREHLQRLQREEIMAELSEEIRRELVSLIAAEWSERFHQLEAQQAALGSGFEELEKTVRQRAEPVQHGGAEHPSPERRPRR
jgi:DNA repair exonuclease SbcCD ATPase subunit